MAVVQKRKIQWAISLFLVMLYFSGLPAKAQYGGGSGEPNYPYLIYTAEQMNAIGAELNDWDKHFKLMADIDLSDFDGKNGRHAFNIIALDTDSTKSWFQGTTFVGVFDGNGHTISNFSYTSTDADYIGLFGYVMGVIKDLGLIDPNIDAGNGKFVGYLVGCLSEGNITGCYVNGGSVSGSSQVGGLVGTNYGTITNCYSVASVSGERAVGGLVGGNGGTITNCYSAASISVDWIVGGLVGYNMGTITGCCSAGSVSGDWIVGGLVGGNEGTITNCYSAASVSGDWIVGGLVGINGAYDMGEYWPGTISKCYATGSVSGANNVGGLLGYNEIGEITYSFWDTQTSGQSSSDGGTSKTTAEMQRASTFIGWGYDPVWTIDEGKDYPRLWWENKPGEALDTQQLSDFLTGAGTEDEPYLIYTDEELNMIGQFTYDWDKHFKLMADIDLSAFTGTDFNIIGYWVDRDSPDNKPFTGVFDGNGQKISNFNYRSTGADAIGLFAFVLGESAQIKDVGLIDAEIDAGTGKHVGSLIGRLINGSVINCYSENGSVSGDNYVGGLVGTNGGVISRCYSYGQVLGDWYVGGLVGMNGSYEFGVSNLGTVSNCYSAANVSASSHVGGLVGYNYFSGLDKSLTGTISNSYSVGMVSHSANIGGLVGRSVGGVTGCYWDIETSGQSTSDGGTGKTTAEMQMESTFTDAGWDFVGETENGTEDIWWILEGQDYPRLWWEKVSD